MGNDHFEVIRLTLPADPRFATVARIVVGGLAARLDLTYEALDDVQLAVESVLADEALPTGDEIALEVSTGDRGLVLLIGPVDSALARERLAAGENVGLRTILGAIVDSAEVGERDGAGWVRLEKRVPLTSRDVA